MWIQWSALLFQGPGKCLPHLLFESIRYIRLKVHCQPETHLLGRFLAPFFFLEFMLLFCFIHRLFCSQMQFLRIVYGHVLVSKIIIIVVIIIIIKRFHIPLCCKSCNNYCLTLLIKFIIVMLQQFTCTGTLACTIFGLV